MYIRALRMKLFLLLLLAMSGQVAAYIGVEYKEERYEVVDVIDVEPVTEINSSENIVTDWNRPFHDCTLVFHFSNSATQGERLSVRQHQIQDCIQTSGERAVRFIHYQQWDATKKYTFFDDFGHDYNLMYRIWGEDGSGNLVRAWEFVFNCPTPIRTNTSILESLSGAIQRGVQNVADALNSVPNFPQMTLDRAEHILRGNGGSTGGVHHISALLSRTDLSLKDIETVLPNGCYKARVQFPGGQYPPKDFFPDSWHETKVLEQIKSAFDNGLTLDSGLGTNAYRGVTSEGVDVVVYMQNASGPIISAHPIIP